MVHPVTDPRKQVTDKDLMSHLEAKGIDSRYVEFYQDYGPAFRRGKRIKERSPYAKFYRDLKTGTKFAVISPLPKVTHDGFRITPGWSINGTQYQARENLFSCVVEGNNVELKILNDQPDGRKKDHKLTYNPQLFIDGSEQSTGDPELLTEDPLNQYYANNVLCWDYGSIKRLLRIIEGQLQGFWLRPVGFDKEIRIKYNQTGDFKQKLGYYRINDDEELVPDKLENIRIPTVSLNGVDYTIVQDSDTFYPDANPESTSCDGTALYHDAAAWATAHDAATGTNAGAGTLYSYILARINGGLYRLDRVFILFDTSALPDAAIISAVTLSVYGEGKLGGGSGRSHNVYSSSPASNTDIVGADYDQIGSTALCDTPITLGSFYTGNPGTANQFAFNATGIAAVSTTGVSKFSMREVLKDVGDTAPTDNIYLDIHMADKGVGYKPTLVVTYTNPSPRVSTAAADNIEFDNADLNGNITDLQGGGNCDERGFDWGRVGQHKVSINSTAHTDFGLTYPVTYKYSIPSGSSGLYVLYRYNTTDPWLYLPQYQSGDLFNGENAARFDYDNDCVYVSIAFDGTSDDIYINIVDGDGVLIASSFVEICEYYDNRESVVVFTADDGGGSSQAEFDCINNCQSRGIWLTDCFVIFYSKSWANFQTEIDEGFLEIANHSYNHQELPYTDYDVEIGDSLTAIKANLDLLDMYKKGSTEYVVAWIEPYGTSDATVRSKLGTYKYLISRYATVGSTGFATWNAGDGLYNRIGPTINLEDSSESTVKSSFDTNHAAGNVWHLQCHPNSLDWSSGQKAQNVLDYIQDKDDIWYVGFGALYMYYYVQERGMVTTSEPGYVDELTEEGDYGTGTYSLNLDSLDADTGYIYRAKCHNTNGWGYGDDVVFTTLPNSPLVDTDPATSIAETSVTGNGDITSAGAENCDKRGFVYGLTSQSDPGNVAPASSGYDDYEEESGSFAAGTFTGSITGLTSSKVYFIRAYAHNSYGYEYGEELMFLTNPNGNFLIPSGNVSAGIRWDTSPGGGYPTPGGSSIEHWILCRAADSTFVSTPYRFGYYTGNFVYERHYYNSNFYTDLYTLTNPTKRDEGIVKVKWKARCGRNNYPYGKYKRVINTHSTTYTGSELSLGSFGWKCEIFYTNPNTGEAWTIDECDNLQAGISVGEAASFGIAMCDAIQVVVLWANAAVTADSGEQIDPSTIRLTGTVSEDEGETCNVHFEWGDTPAYGNTTTEEEKAKGESFTADITASGSIYYRAVIETACGETFYSDGQYMNAGADDDVIIIP
jgi:hypothetical protein